MKIVCKLVGGRQLEVEAENTDDLTHGLAHVGKYFGWWVYKKYRKKWIFHRFWRDES